MTKQISPLIVTKESSPYLMLSEYSGIFLNDYDTNNDKIISIPVNDNEIEELSLVGIQVWSRYPLNSFSSSARFLSIYNEIEEINFNINIEPGGDRAFISSDHDDLVYSQRGVDTNYPVIYPQQWQSTYIYFKTPIEFHAVKGEIKLYPGFVFQNISIFYYESLSALLSQDESNIYDDQIGTSIIVCEDSSSVEVFSNGADVFTDIVWQTFEKPVV